MPILPCSWGDNNKSHPNSQESQTSIANEALSPTATIFVTFLLGSAATACSIQLYKRYGRRIRNSAWITPKHLTKKRWIKGVVTSVGDADNFRLYHTPALGYNWPVNVRQMPTLSKDLKDETIHVRVAGIDAPEGPHFGKPGQPYATEALEWLRSQLLGKRVYCQLLRKDQYGRVVSHVHLAPSILPGFIFYGKDIARSMLKDGWAVTYEQAGAEYGHLGKEGYLQLEEEAKSALRGMWKDGVKGESPSAYKRRQTGAPETKQVANRLKEAQALVPSRKGWLKWLLGR